MPKPTRRTSATPPRSASRILARGLLTIAGLAAIGLVLYALPYDWDFAPAWERRGLFLQGLKTTLLATAGGYLLGLALGILVALARLSRSLPIRHLGDLYVELIRGTPFLVQVSIWYFGVATIVGIDDKLLVGAFALGVFGAAYMGEIFRAGIESIEGGQFEAARSLGLSRLQTLRHVVLPQAFKRMIPPLTGELIALTKESSLLLAIGLLELYSAGRQVGADTYSTLEPYLVVAGFYLAITVPLSLLARRLERRLGRSVRLAVSL